MRWAGETAVPAIVRVCTCLIVAYRDPLMAYLIELIYRTVKMFSLFFSVECYDPHTNKWTLRAPMNRRRGGVGVSVANGFLYALGGHDCPASNPAVSRTDTVERYDPATDTWTLVSFILPWSVGQFFNQ